MYYSPAFNTDFIKINEFTYQFILNIFFIKLKLSDYI